MKKFLLRTAGVAVILVASLGLAVAQDNQEGGRQLGPDDAVARVNGEEILLSDLLTARTLLPPEVRGQQFELLFPQLLQLVIEQRLFSAAASAAEVPADPGFQRELRFIADRLLQDRYIDLLLNDSINQEVFDAEVAALREELGDVEQVRARHILLTDKSDVTLADELIARAKGGEDFGALASEYSKDPGSAARGGDLGTFGRGMMVAEFEAAVFSQEVGAISDAPVESDFGLHIILVEDRFMVEPNPEQLAERALQRLQARIVSEKAQELRAAASVQVLDQDGNLPDASQ